MNSIWKENLVHLETSIVNRIQSKIRSRGSDLATEIKLRSLYFRVSVLGTCNLSCPFCHNEGAPVSGRLDPKNLVEVYKQISALGFERIQFTGGEPTLHKSLPEFIRNANEFFSDIGITTNGFKIVDLFSSLMQSGLKRIHLSLQVEDLIKSGSSSRWGVPSYLRFLLSRTEDSQFKFRINLPAPLDNLDQIKLFLEDLAIYRCDINVFSILPNFDKLETIHYDLDILKGVVSEANKFRTDREVDAKVFMRDFVEPSGIRCKTCDELGRCKEKSHSLRLGSDNILRPCLASREWDIPLNANSEFSENLRRATLLALDYEW